MNSLFIIVRNRLHLLKFRRCQIHFLAHNLPPIVHAAANDFHQQYQERTAAAACADSEPTVSSFEGDAATARVRICLSTLHH